MSYTDKVKLLTLALQAQGFNVDWLTVENFLETEKLIDAKGEKTDLKDVAKIKSDYDKRREAIKSKQDGKD